MDAVKFLKEYNRMLKKPENGSCGINCEGCPISSYNNGHDVSCQILRANYPEDAVRIVNKWSEEHPQKTYLMDFLEKFPHCVKDAKWFPVSCRKFIYPLMQRANCSGLNCSECWNEPMEDKQ